MELPGEEFSSPGFGGQAERYRLRVLTIKIAIEPNRNLNTFLFLVRTIRITSSMAISFLLLGFGDILALTKF